MNEEWSQLDDILLNLDPRLKITRQMFESILGRPDDIPRLPYTVNELTIMIGALEMEIVRLRERLDDRAE